MNDMQLGKVLASKYDDDGFLTVQMETFGTGAKSVGWFYLSNPHGLQMRPLDPDTSGIACQAYYWYDGSQGYAMLANDPRTQGDVSIQLQKGECILHHPLGVGFVRMKADGSISLFTTDDNTSNGRSVAFVVAPTGLSFNFPFGRMTFDDSGYHVVTNSGARLDLGAIAAPAPINALSSYATLSAAMVHVEGSAVHTGIAPDPLIGPPSQPVALADAVLTLCAALHGVLEAIGEGTLLAPPGSAGGPCTPGPDLVTALAAANAAMVQAATAVPSISSSATGAA